MPQHKNVKELLTALHDATNVTTEKVMSEEKFWGEVREYIHLGRKAAKTALLPSQVFDFELQQTQSTLPQRITAAILQAKDKGRFA